jgi:peroxiredoxin
VAIAIPPFAMNHPEKGHISSLELLGTGALLVTFYRRLWRSYCQRDLLGMEEAFPAIRRTNSSVVAIANGLGQDVRAKLKETTNISFPIIDDTDGAMERRRRRTV